MRPLSSPRKCKVTATLTPVHNHLGQTPSKCSQGVPAPSCPPPLPGAASNTAQRTAPPALGRGSGAPAQERAQIFSWRNPRPGKAWRAESSKLQAAPSPACSSPLCPSGLSLGSPPSGSLPEASSPLWPHSLTPPPCSEGPSGVEEGPQWQNSWDLDLLCDLGQITAYSGAPSPP